MKTHAQLSLIGRTLFAGMIALNFSTPHAGAGSAITFTPNPPALRGDANSDSFAPSYLAQRLGLTQKFTELPGVAVKDHSGHKVGRLEDIVVDLSSGHILCALVANGDNAVVPTPGMAFDMADATQARLATSGIDLSAAPHVPGGDLPAILNSIPACNRYFGQKTLANASATAQPTKCSELIGRKVQGKAGDPLGEVVNVMVDVPTARVVFVVVSFNGKTTGFYAVPPGAFQNFADRSTPLVLNAEPGRIAAFAHSDGFFWSNMAEPNWCIDMYHAFGQQADFDPARKEIALQSAVPVTANPAPKGDREISKDILMAMMRDNVDNPFIYKNVRIKPVNGQVTLSGQVRNENQRSKLVSIAASVAGAENIHDEIQVK